ncbi:MAG: YceI family protein [Actinomycetota bacterium]|nr:YceI family protein [Actinomycetota bacterium]
MALLKNRIGERHRDVLAEIEGRWAVDPEHSALGFSVRHMMISTVRGRFDDFEGSFELLGDGSLDASLSIATKSINTGNAERDTHLRTNDFLATERYPHIAFRATAIDILNEDHARVAGDLTVRGVTRPVILDVGLNGYVPADWKGRPRLSLTAKATINRKDFGVSWNQVLESGGVLVGDKIELDLEIAAIRSKS